MDDLDDLDYEMTQRAARLYASTTGRRQKLWQCPMNGWMYGTQRRREYCLASHGYRRETWGR